MKRLLLFVALLLLASISNAQYYSTFDSVRTKAIKMDSLATPISVPYPGLIEYNNKAFMATPQDGQRMIIEQRCLAKTSADSFYNTDTVAVACSLFVAGGKLYAGQVIRAKMLGRLTTANSSQYVTVTFFLGADSVMAVATPPKNVTNSPVEIEFTITVYSLGTTGKLVAHAIASIDNVNLSMASNALNTINTTTNNTFYGKVKLSSATAGNKIVFNGIYSIP